MSSGTAPDPGATQSLRARLAAGPVARAIAVADLRVYRLVRRAVRVRALERPIRLYTTAGEHGALWYAVGVVGSLADRRRGRCWARAMLAVLLTELVNTAVKSVFRRSRPAVEELPALIAVPTSLSFPSAHASMSFAAARAYGRLVPRRRRLLYAAAALMAASRVYVGVHYPSDVVVGAALGTAVGSVVR